MAEQYSDQYKFRKLEAAALDVNEKLKSLPDTDIRESKIAVIGGLAIWKYLSKFRMTNDVDFLITFDKAPRGVKEKLLRNFPHRFRQYADYFYYTKNDLCIQIDMTHQDLSPYIPHAAKRIASIRRGELPYITKNDLITFKINMCAVRGHKAEQDALDAAKLLHHQYRRGKPLRVDDVRWSYIKRGLDDIVRHTGTPQAVVLRSEHKVDGQ